IVPYAGARRAPSDEIQSAALRNFEADGDSFTLTYDGATSAPIVRGTNYNAGAIKAAIESIAGGDERVVGWGGAGQPGDAGFQVTFGGSQAARRTAELQV